MPSATADNEYNDLVDARKTLIAAAWCRTLGIDRVHPDTNFFLAGGDSLLATRLLRDLAELTGVRLPLRTLFDAPTLAELTARLESAGSAEASDDPAAHHRQGASPSSNGPASARMSATPPRATTRLSFSQERMWFMHALASASAAYHVTLALRLQGPLDTSALQRAVDRVVERHETLRATFITHGSGVYPRIAPTGRIQVSQVTLLSTHAGAELDAARAYLSEFANGTFDLETGPLLRVALVHMAPNDAVLLFVAHHIIADQWSLDVLVRELAGFYAHETGGPEFSPPPLPKRYSAYADWHRRWFDTERRQKEIAYWTRRLANLDPVVLNADFARPPQQSFRGAKLRTDFDPADIEALRTFAAAQRTTPALVLLTVLNVLLHRHTSQTDIGVGVPIANRHHADSEPLIGTLVNTLVVRTDLSGDISFEQALKRVHQMALEAFEHQDAPFEAIVKELHIPRDASRSALFSVLFNMLNTPLGPVEFPGLSWSRFDFDKKASQFDLTVTIDAAYDRSICFEYATDLFAPVTIARLAEHFVRLLRAAIQAPAERIGALPMLGEEERELLSQWSRGRTQIDSQQTIVDLLAETCKRVPDAVALTIAKQTFTYRELHGASDRLAASLRARGVTRGTRVGLCLHRSPQLVIAQWAALKCGAAYVPLDPSYPRERLCFMVQDAQLAMLVTDPALAQYLNCEQLCPTIEVDAELASDLATPVAIEPPTPADAAYVIYTSGSTGQPKGVVVSHGAVTNFLKSMAVEPGLSATDRVLAITTLSFDIAVLELLLPWSVGAHVVMATHDQITDADALQRMIAEEKITLMQATPSTWRMLIDAGWEGSNQLRALVGGEPLPSELASHLLARCAQVWNMYGPTETTVWSTCWRVRAPLHQGISLGHPIANTQVYVLDGSRRLSPIGVPGEIFIAGSGLADGYFNRPELTADRFVSGPSDAEPTRLYRTGDRGRWRHDGQLEHLGRLDTQIKIRGHRIELGEIESHLAQHEAVRRALVTTRENRAGDVHLIAYVIPREEMPAASSLRAFLRERLPDYMLPQWFVSLAAIPTLPNGKTDLKRLPAPQQDATMTLDSEPRNAFEKDLCAIWRDILQVERVGIHDNFFDLGGHSILTVRLVSRIRLDLRRACTLPMIFRYPTVATLAAALEDASALEGNSLIALQPLGADPPLFCICGIQIYQELADRFAPDVPVYGVFVPMEMEYVTPSGHDQRTLPAVERLAAEYLQTVRVRQPHGPYRLLGFSFGGVLAFEMAQQLKAQGEDVSFLAILDSDVPDRRRRPRPSRLDQRLRTLKQRLGRRLKGRAQRWAGVAPELAEARDERYLEAMHSYAAAPYSGPAVYIQAIDATEYNPGYGWDAIIPGIHSYRIPGDHLGILRSPHVDLLAAKLRFHLEGRK